MLVLHLLHLLLVLHEVKLSVLFFFPFWCLILKKEVFLCCSFFLFWGTDFGVSEVRISCDYGNGKWVRSKIGPLYNGTSCSTIKDNQNCMIHGRPDTGYLYWKWKPKQCKIPRFEPNVFLEMMRNKHLAFVGDSIARNQAESLLCLLSTGSSPKLVYPLAASAVGEDEKKFRKWHFPSHNVSVSIYWSPFLVKGIEKKSEVPPQNYNTLYLESVDERWATDITGIDMIILSVGHWFLHRAVYFYDETVLGCHFCSGLTQENYTEIGFYDVYGKAFETALNSIMEKNGISNSIDVVVTTFSPAHFEGEWDKFGACPKTKPFSPLEKKLEGMDAEMRKIEMEQIKTAQELSKNNKNLRIEAVDVTKLSLLRPDGHPGPYLYPFPFANGIPDRVQNDCVHWCMPGPIDTWNEILLDIIKKWER